MIQINLVGRRFSATALLVCSFAASASAQVLPGWPAAPFPVGNPTFASTGNVTDLHRELLGKNLFHDQQLSVDGTVACASCHDSAFGGADKNAGVQHPGPNGIFGDSDDTFGSPGVIRSDTASNFQPSGSVFGVGRQATELNAPTVIGAAFFKELFWDKRAKEEFRLLPQAGSTTPGAIITNFATNAALESLSVVPPVNAVEMGHDNPFVNSIESPHAQWSQIETKLGSMFPLSMATNIPPTFAVLPGVDYDQMFTIAFGAGPITREKIGIAIAAYMRTLIPNQAPIDLGTMTDAQERGLGLFVQHGCVVCHSNGGSIQFAPGTDPSSPSYDPATTNPVFLDPSDLLFSDGNFHNIGLINHSRTVKTPTLRNVGLRKRLFHSGHSTSVMDAMNIQYNNPDPAIPAFVKFSPPLAGQDLTDLVDFLENALTDPRVQSSTVPFDAPTLRGDGTPFGADLVGAGLPGTGGVTPTMIANSPPRIGNAQWRLGVGTALANSAAALYFAPALQPGPPGQLLGGLPVELDHSQLQNLGTFAISPSGTATVHDTIPLDPSLINTTLNYQWFVFDPGSPAGIAVSRAATYTVF